jgi:hypothetical protein
MGNCCDCYVFRRNRRTNCLPMEAVEDDLRMILNLECFSYIWYCTFVYSFNSTVQNNSLLQRIINRLCTFWLKRLMIVLFTWILHIYNVTVTICWTVCSAVSRWYDAVRAITVYEFVVVVLRGVEKYIFTILHLKYIQ